MQPEKSRYRLSRKLCANGRFRILAWRCEV
jgi:hypothetical protein